MTHHKPSLPQIVQITPDRIHLQGRFSDYELEAILQTASKVQGRQKRERDRRALWLRYGAGVPVLLLTLTCLFLAAVNGCTQANYSPKETYERTYQYR